MKAHEKYLKLADDPLKPVQGLTLSIWGEESAFRHLAFLLAGPKECIQCDSVGVTQVLTLSLPRNRESFTVGLCWQSPEGEQLVQWGELAITQLQKTGCPNPRRSLLKTLCITLLWRVHMSFCSGVSDTHLRGRGDRTENFTEGSWSLFLCLGSATNRLQPLETEYTSGQSRWSVPGWS